jgi:hypothetical protein
VRSQTPKFWPLFRSTGELITTAPAAVPVAVSMTWQAVHGASEDQHRGGQTGDEGASAPDDVHRDHCVH